MAKRRRQVPIVSEERRLEILRTHGIRIVPGTPAAEVEEAMAKLERERARPHGGKWEPLTHHGYGRGDIPTTRPSSNTTISFSPVDIPSVTEGKSSAVDFTHALMTGNPNAERAMRAQLGDEEYKRFFGRGKEIKPEITSTPGVGTRVDLVPKEKPSLADMFIAETYNTAKRLKLNAHQRKKIEPYMSSYRRDMRKANRFVLDDDFTKYATEMSANIQPEKLLARLQYANLPYETTWIEFDMMTKVRTMRAIHKMDDSTFDYNEVADRMGLLMHRLDETSALVEMIIDTVGDYGLVGSVICYYFSMNERQWRLSDGRNFNCSPIVPELVGAAIEGVVTQQVWERHVEDRNKQIGAASLWGFGEKGESKMMSSMYDMRELRLPSFLMRHGVIGLSRQWQLFQQLDEFQTARGKEAMTELMVRETTEFTGMMRWVVCILAMLNEVPVTAHHVEPRTYIRTGLTNRIPSMDYHKVTLRLPKKNPIKFLERQFVIATRRRAHKVRQHWRTYLHEEHCRYDEHDWVYDHENGYRLCGKCEAYGRLIHEHKRGDESLGWVRKDYVLKPSDET